ncbi:hypothetical protein FRX31_002405, partial [Thalictrum thalictroides]
MKLEKHFKKQGITGPPYKFLHGNMKDILSLMLQVQSKPMEHSHRIVRRVLPYIYQTAENY